MMFRDVLKCDELELMTHDCLTRDHFIQINLQQFRKWMATIMYGQSWDQVSKHAFLFFLGGHSTELIQLVNRIPADLQPTNYIMCYCDKTTAPPESRCIIVPRARKSGQSYITSVFTCLWSLM